MPNLSLDKDILEWISTRFNRNPSQTEMIFNLVDGNLELLIKLELKIKNCCICYCPSNKLEIHKILKMNEHKKWFKL